MGETAQSFVQMAYGMDWGPDGVRLAVWSKTEEAARLHDDREHWPATPDNWRGY
ncbi:MAG: hypothetical protein R3C44_09755 [Chloroflexota bacterium]